MHVQACGKQRPIDNGRSAGHNDLAWAEETIITNTPDFAAAAARELMRLARQDFPENPPWLVPMLGTEDMAWAYRQMLNKPQESPGLVIALWHPETASIRYAIMRAHPFGLASAVLNCNRLPALATAITRQCTATASAAYFDDTGVFDLACNRGSGQECVGAVYGCLGAILDVLKQQPMASQRCFLGVLLNLAGVSESLTMQVDLKPGLREALQLELQNILEQGSLSSGQASKLRGRFQWASSAMYGRVARGGQGPLVRRQYEDLDELTPELKESLKFMLALLEVVSPREIPLSPVSSEVVILYTDASFEPGLMQSPGLGAVCMQRDDPVTRGLAGTVPEQVLNALEEREQQIAPLEAMAVWWATIAFSSHLRNRDVVWFIDNQAICAALVRGSSGCDDISGIVSLCHLAWASLSARV